MNAQAAALTRPRSGGTGPMTGFGQFLRKEVREWLRARRFITMTVAATALAVLGVLVERIRQAAGDTSAPYNLDPSFNLSNVGWVTLVPLFAAFGTMALITAEREKGTLAWSLSMPLSRPAVLISKLLVGIAFLGIAAVVIPELVSIAAIRVAYGGFPHQQELLWEPLGAFAVGAFLVALNVAASTFVRGQVAVVGTTLCSVLTVPPLVGLISKDLQRFLPTEIYGYVTARGHGDPTHAETLGAWVVAMAALIAVALVQFRRREV